MLHIPAWMGNWGTLVMPDDERRQPPAGWREAPTHTHIAMEIHEALGNLRAPPTLLAIIAKWMVTADDENILELLQDYNSPSFVSKSQDQ